VKRKRKKKGKKGERMVLLKINKVSATSSLFPVWINPSLQPPVAPFLSPESTTFSSATVSYNYLSR